MRWLNNKHHLLELRPQFNWRICWVCSSFVPNDETIFQSVEIGLQQRRKPEFDEWNWNTTVKSLPTMSEKKITCTRSKSEVAFTGRNRDRGTLIPIALSKNWFRGQKSSTIRRQIIKVQLLRISENNLYVVNTLIAAPAAVSSWRTLIPSTSYTERK